MKKVDARASGNAGALVRKLWQYCNILRDDGLSYPDYVEQLTYLLFLKMSDEQDNGPVPVDYSWCSFAGLEAEAMHRHYARALSVLGMQDGMLGLIFRNAKNKIRDPAKLRLLVVDLIGQTEWTGLSADLKGEAYEGLLEKNAKDTKSGAGQYFTPRPLIDAIIECIAPQLGEIICDPACGTAGFLLAAYEFLRMNNPYMTREQQVLAAKSLRGVELVEEVARLAAMNLILHGISGSPREELPIECADSLKNPPRRQVDVVLTNPPFGVKGSVTYAKGGRHQRAGDDLTVLRPDFWVQTANKQLNFLQHIVSLLKPGGRAAVILPDNALFEVGAAASVRKGLLEACSLIALLRLPTGIFYAQGVKASVLFFRHNLSSRHKWPHSGVFGVYDLRLDNRFSLRANPLQRGDLDEFVGLFKSLGHVGSLNMGGGRDNCRWRLFDQDHILNSRHCSLDLTWDCVPGQEGTPGLARLDEISKSISDDLRRALTLMENLHRRTDA